MNPQLIDSIRHSVKLSLEEDIGDGDASAAVLDASQLVQGRILCRESAVICGRAWVDEVLRQVNSTIGIQWLVQDGDRVETDAPICVLQGPVTALLAAERCALNWLQMLSAVATTTARYVQALQGTRCVILDTRKTIPGLRLAQKYATAVGGAHNHRMGLFDAVMLKENHLLALGGIRRLKKILPKIDQARVIVEVETLDELAEAIAAGVQHVLLDNFDLTRTQQAVALAAGRVRLEASGTIGLAELKPYAACGVDYISVGALTKNIQAVDFSFKICNLPPAP